MEKSVDAFRTISEVAEDVALPQHVLRFWETRFPQIRPLKRAGGRRYYRPADVILLRTIRQLLYEEGYTIKGVQKLLKDQGTRALRAGVPRPVDLAEIDPGHALALEVAAADITAADITAAEVTAAEVTAAEVTAADLAVVDRPAAIAAEPEAALPESIRAVLDTPSAPADAPRSRACDLAVVRDALAVIDECERILAGLRRTQP